MLSLQEMVPALSNRRKTRVKKLSLRKALVASGASEEGSARSAYESSLATGAQGSGGLLGASLGTSETWVSAEAAEAEGGPLAASHGHLLSSGIGLARVATRV